ncbi:Palmitoyltransferase [Coniochaeta hoffmannii]|uniref:Palmitoyltransferase n=1 Tax=Coniochaeta hoffmannii TaxID=91930 RepID=A0AA38RL81_9PEZI|nr:Palmitoyltransferase [Coniochaeta hoffmannii]
MATRTSGDGAARSTPSPTGNDDSFPQYPRQEVAGPPSIISSRMTDIASEDTPEHDARQTAAASNPNRRSLLASESRPGTARTGVSSRAQPQPLRRGLSGKRGSINSTTSGSVAGRPTSSAGRSHVPSLTSHAFFRPMSSQKLQAQRGVTRPSTMSRPPQDAGGDSAPENDGDTARQSIISNPVAQLARRLSNEGEMRPPPSRGTEMTEPETFGRQTANTSPTQGHYATASLSESVRPLQKQPPANRNLTLNIDKTYKSGVNVPTPMKSPRSFRSSFLMPTRNDSNPNSNRDMRGGEKLDSVASSPRLSPANPNAEVKLPGSKPNMGYNYEYFMGNTVFCIGGRLQNTRHRPVNIGTGFVVVLPAILFFIFSAPWLWHNISPAIPIVFAYIMYICVSSFIHASTSDPGILPRNLHQFPPASPNEDPLVLGPPTNDWTLVKSAEKSAAAMEVPTKYCKTCNIWRPPRAHHCRLCDNCIETQDHHCVWVNNCVGRRNYRYFFTFVLSLMTAASYLLAASLAQILVYMNREHISFGASISHFRVPFAMVIYGFFGIMYPAALTGYHVFLMARGETTREYLNSHKFLKKDRYRAFTQASWVKNWWVVLCRPRPPTYYQFKKRYTPGDQRLGQNRREGKVRTREKEGVEMTDVKRGEQNPPPAFQGPVAVRGAAKAMGAAEV